MPWLERIAEWAHSVTLFAPLTCLSVKLSLRTMSARKRSLRLSSLEKSSKAVDLSSSSSKRSKTENYSDNFLSSLPHAVVAQLFPLLTSDDLRRIALTCRGALDRVEWFLSSDKALLSALDIRLVSRFEKDPDAKERVVTFPCHHHLTERFKRLGRHIISVSKFCEL